jgi:hypothetical protein
MSPICNPPYVSGDETVGRAKYLPDIRKYRVLSFTSSIYQEYLGSTVGALDCAFAGQFQLAVAIGASVAVQLGRVA